MSDWLLALEGTDAGRQAALWLALLSALAHALFGALQKGRFDPWLMRGAIDMALALMALPVALFLVPWPEPHMWPIFAGVVVVHAGYKLSQAAAFARGAYTVVYPVVRGTGPLLTVLAAGLIFGERFTAGQWMGLAVLVGGIFGLAAYNLRHVIAERARLPAALALAVLTGGFVALYTTYDAWGIRMSADPLTFLAWFFVFDGLVMPLVMRRALVSVPKEDRRALAKKAVFGALVAYISFGSFMLATRIGNVGEAAVLRETSTVFAAFIGWMLLGETTGPRRIALMATIAAGAMIVKFAG